MYIIMAVRAPPPQYLTEFMNAIGRLNGLTANTERDSARLNTERQNFTRDARARLATMSTAVDELNGRVTAFVAELARLRQEVIENDATIERNLATIDRLNDDLDALRNQGSILAPGAAPVIRDGYADIRRLEAENDALRELNTTLVFNIAQATPLLVRIEAVFAQINANPIPTAELLTEMDRLNREIEAILALLPGPGPGARPGSGPPPPGSGSGGFLSGFFGSSSRPNPPPGSGSGSGGPPPPGSGSGGLLSGLFGSSDRPNPPPGSGSGSGGVFSGSLNSSGRPNPLGVAPRPDLRTLGGQPGRSSNPLTQVPRRSFQPDVGSFTPASFFPDNLNNELRQNPPASSSSVFGSTVFGGKRKKSKKQKGGYIYKPSTKHTFKSPKRTTKTTGRTTRSTKRSTSRRRTKRVKI